MAGGSFFSVSFSDFFEIFPTDFCRVKNIKRRRILFDYNILDSRITARSVALVKVKISRADLGKITDKIALGIFNNAIILEVTHADTLAELSDI